MVMQTLLAGEDVKFDREEQVAIVFTVCPIQVINCQLNPTDVRLLLLLVAKTVIPHSLRSSMLQLIHLGHLGIQTMK